VARWMLIFVTSNKYIIVIAFILTFLLCTNLILVLFAILVGIRTATSDGAIYQSSTSFSHDCYMLFLVL
jgi:succinate dehydrogenase/fumarate reductase cytochrome b subunit